MYFFTEPGELRINGESRIVRVGTHAVSANAKSTLWSRLRAHRGQVGGGGNHRGSIFRLHVGGALLARDGVHSRLPSWGVGSSAHKDIRVLEEDHERNVSAYLGSMSVLWVDVPDGPGPLSERAFIERNAIALLSNHTKPLDQPSPEWLGRFSIREEIRASGLWNLNYVGDAYDPTFLDIIAHAAERTAGRTRESSHSGVSVMPPTTAAQQIRSAKVAIRAVLPLPILDRHKNELLSVLICKITQAEGKYALRHKSAGTLANPSAKKQHEHVFPRKWLIAQLKRPDIDIDAVSGDAIGCVVTIEEHKRLSRVDPELVGWQRYAAASIDVLDTVSGQWVVHDGRVTNSTLS